MPANYMRRRDLFLDAGFGDPEATIHSFAQEVAQFGLAPTRHESLESLRKAVRTRAARVPEGQLALALLVPEWLMERNGDLASVLWLAQAEHRGRLDVNGFILAIFQAFLDAERVQDALTFARFMFDIDFHWGEVYGDPGIAYGFMRERDPNPLVWRVLDALQGRSSLRVLELGCGIGNDAVGFLQSSSVESYVGLDMAEQALTQFRFRVEHKPTTVHPELIGGDIISVLEDQCLKQHRPNLIYSYSSLHYFASSELQQILGLVKRNLLRCLPDTGYFAFAIKGAGSLWEGQGLPLYRPDVWINYDGQSRWFPTPKALANLLDRAGFELRLHEMHDHWGYSEPGKRDVFHYVLCSPRAEYVGAAI
ncbi:MAG: hypothetical protein CO108_22210 [Deltaproteobacteria bacterium CG_4_9_14_3_um_filter_63_12]|nr:MAG: hypothetical protein CO108_22210 [Deltaproteobacteria bacterium CG_4_9_14_3_um_filter_63_12]